MNRKYPLKLFIVGLILNFLFRYFYLFLPGVILSFIGIWSEQCLAIGLAMLLVDLVLSFVEQLRIRKAALQESDNAEFNELADAIFDPNSPKTLDDIVKEKQAYQIPKEDDHQKILKKLVVYRTLRQSVHSEMALDELINAFQEMCRIPVGQPDDLLFETGTYSFTGEKLFVFSLVRQFQFLDDNEYVQLHLDVNYAPSFKTALLYRVKWCSNADDKFFSMVKKSLAYYAVQKMPIFSVDVRIEET